MRIRGILCSVLAAALLAACGSSELLAPPSPMDHLGTYRLATVFGKPLPVIAMHQLNYNLRRVITAGQLSLSASNDYTVQVSWRDEGETSGAVIDSGTDVERGHYSRTADSVEFSDRVEQARDTISTSAFGPTIMRAGQLGLPELDAPIYFLEATFQKQ